MQDTAKGDYMRWRLGSALLVVAGLFSSGCWSGLQPSEKQTVVSAGAAAGTLHLDIVQPGEPEYYWQYEIEPAKGSVRVTYAETFASYKVEQVAEEHLRSGSFAMCKDREPGVSPDG